MKVSFSLFILVFVLQFSFAQYNHEGVFPDKEGVELRQLVIENFRPSVVYDYGEARDTLYGVVYNVNDSIAGIYSDHKRYLQPGADPTTYVFDDGSPNGINAEHSYPQSKGAGSGNPRSDMHHLFPSRVAANSARGSLPFGEVNDSSTDTWFYLTTETGSTPNSSTIDLYSEKGQGKWEPRESVKGNIARAIFYFYTMYKDQADAADPDFFDIQKDDLCAWHNLDPVDQLEWERTKMISKYQQDKSNPFVLDCTLAFRLFCGEVSDECTIVDVEEVLPNAEMNVLGNPVRDEVFFEAYTERKLNSYRVISATSGQLVQAGAVNQMIYPGEKYGIDLHNISKGSYIVQWIVEDPITGQQYAIPYKIIKI